MNTTEVRRCIQLSTLATLNEVATHSFSNLRCYDGHLSVLQLVSRHVIENSGDPL